MQRFSQEDSPSLSKPVRENQPKTGQKTTHFSKKEHVEPVLAVFAAAVIFIVLALSLSRTASGESASAHTKPIPSTPAVTYTPEFLENEAARIVFSSEDSRPEDPETAAFRMQLENLLSGYPMETMIPAMLEKDRSVAAFLIGIAKKESNWGKRVPLDASGGDCYNYWGYRAPGSLGTQRLGYGCFETPEEAIAVVGGRIETLAFEYRRDTPSEMIVWKCGSTCAGHSPQSVSKWISDVSLYYGKVLAMAQ